MFIVAVETKLVVSGASGWLLAVLVEGWDFRSEGVRGLRVI